MHKKPHRASFSRSCLNLLGNVNLAVDDVCALGRDLAHLVRPALHAPTDLVSGLKSLCSLVDNLTEDKHPTVVVNTHTGVCENNGTHVVDATVLLLRGNRNHVGTGLDLVQHVSLLLCGV